jgi:hypothetical protein
MVRRHDDTLEPRPREPLSLATLLSANYKGEEMTDIQEHVRPRFTKFQKTKIAFLIAGFVSFVFSVSLWFFVDKDQGVFVGLWVPSVLALGVLLLVGERNE